MNAEGRQERRLLAVVLPGAGWLEWRRFVSNGGENEFVRLAARGFSAPLENITVDGREEGLATLTYGCSAAFVRDGLRPVWEHLRAAGKTVHVIGWPDATADDLAGTRGVTVGPEFPKPTAAPGDLWPPMPGAVEPENVAAGLAAMRVVPEQVGAGWLQFFISDAAAVDQERDARMAVLAIAIAEALSFVSVAEHLLERGDGDATFIVLPTLQTITGLSGKNDAFSACALRGWAFHSQLLGRVLAAAGDTANVWVAGVPAWPPLTASRTRGFILAAGPDIPAAGRVPQRHIADVTAEWLALCGGKPGSLNVEPRALVPGQTSHSPPAELPALLLSGEASLQRRDWAAAEEFFRQAGMLDPEEPLAPLGRSVALLRQRRWEDAETAARQSLALDDSISTSHFYAGRALFRQQRFGEAQAAFVRAIEELPSCRAAAFWLIWIMERIHRDFRGADHWRRVLRGARES